MLESKINNILMDSKLNNQRKVQLVELEILLVIDKLCKKYNLQYWLDAGTLLGAVRHKGFIPWDDDIDICMPRKDYNKFISILDKELPNELVYEHKYTKTWYQKNMHRKECFLKIYYLKHFKSVMTSQNYEVNGVFIDIFPVDSVDEQMCRSKIVKLLSRASSGIVRRPKCLGDYFRYIFSHLNIEKFLINKCNRLELKNKSKYVVYGMETQFMDKKFMHLKDDIYPLSNISFEGHMLLAPKNYKKYLQSLYGNYSILPPEDKRTSHFKDLEII